MRQGIQVFNSRRLQSRLSVVGVSSSSIYLIPIPKLPVFVSRALIHTRKLRSSTFTGLDKLQYLRTMASATEQTKRPWYLESSYPVLVPFHPALNLSSNEFEAFLRHDLQNGKDGMSEQETAPTTKKDKDGEDSFTMVSEQPSTTAEVRDLLRDTELDDADQIAVTHEAAKNKEEQVPPFIARLASHAEVVASSSREPVENKMLTENGANAFRSTREATLDLFYELEEVVSGPRLLELLNASWNEDALMTLKIIFNARSIHLGKASRVTFYRSAGWLAQYHPLTLITNLRWLSRGVIEKKAESKENGDEDVILVDKEPDSADVNDPARFDVKNGLAHGYWKDMLNMLAIAIHGHLGPLANPKEILNVERQAPGLGKGEKPDKKNARALRHDARDQRHESVQIAFKTDAVYRGLHLAVARLFAEQLQKDLASLRSDREEDKTRISLCAKWAPTSGRFHDKHTFVASSIAELLHPLDDLARGDFMSRDVYLRHARELYRRDVSALRGHLCVVERYMSAKSLDKIRYDRVPSIAMNNYAKIFAAKDTERFEKYIDGVAQGKGRISGAILLPSTLVQSARTQGSSNKVLRASALANPKEAIEMKMKEISRKVIDGQWKTLVQRIKDSGTLESSIAICDVSGSMTHPKFPDGTCPMDSAIGLSLLLAEVTEGGFGGHFITFSGKPTVQKIDLDAPLSKKIHALERSEWGINTDFEAVFLKLILPMAKGRANEKGLKQGDMVKQVFVFSDMQFDSAGGSGWDTTYQRIKKEFALYGYEVPRLIFWNLAGGRAGVTGGCGDPTAPKPVEASEENAALVSGYSQGMLKAFLDNGSFDEPEEEGQEPDKEDDMGEEEIASSATEERDEAPTKKRKTDPMSTLKRTVGHKAYDMLTVVD